jgi:hypothetical protein
MPSVVDGKECGLPLIGGHDDCGAAGELSKNPDCDKDPNSFFLTIHRRG